MTAEVRSCLRAVVLPATDAYSEDTPTRRLLGGLGHDVTRASSPAQALELVNADHTDLLVVDVANSEGNRTLLSAISDLPQSKQPQQIAIFTDAIDGSLRETRKAMGSRRVHLFVKPLHMHGLLSVLRKMDAEQQQ